MIVKTKKGDLPVRYGMNALAHFGDLTGKSMNEVMDGLGDLGKLKLSEVLAFIYVGFVDGANYKEEECKVISISDVGNMIDDDGDLLGKVTDVFQNNAAQEGEKKDEEVKKK